MEQHTSSGTVSGLTPNTPPTVGNIPTLEYPTRAWELLEKGAGYNLFTALAAVYGCSEPELHKDVRPLAHAHGRVANMVIGRFGRMSPVIDFAETASMQEQITLAKRLDV